MSQLENAMRPITDAGGVLQEVEARGFEFAGVIVFNPRTKEAGMLWATGAEAVETDIMVSLGIDPEKMRRIEARIQ